MFLEQLINDIESAGIATFGEDMYASLYPADAPDKCIVVRENMPLSPLKDLPVEFYAIQFLSRAIDYEDAYNNAWELYKRYHGRSQSGKWKALHNYMVGNRYVFVSKASQVPFDISPDEKGRSEVSLNIVFRVRTE